MTSGTNDADMKIRENQKKKTPRGHFSVQMDIDERTRSFTPELAFHS